MSEAVTSADAAKATTTTTAHTSRPIHPAVLTAFGPGKGSGSSELSVWAYLTRPRPSSGNGDDNDGDDDAPLPNLVTSQSNSLRVYTVLPNAGTLALTAVYDNLAGTICSLDVIPNGTSAGGAANNNCARCRGRRSGKSSGGADGAGNDDGLDEIFADDNNINIDDKAARDGSPSQCKCSYDGLLLGFAGHPRLSLVYPSIPMVGGGVWSSSSSNTLASNKDSQSNNNSDDPASGGGGDMSEHNLTSGVGTGGVLLASSIVDLTPALIERSMGGTSFLEQDIIVTVSTSSTIASGVAADRKSKRANNTNGDDDPSVSVVLGGGVAIASFSLPKGPRPNEGQVDEIGGRQSSWWRVASAPYILPLSSLSTKIRDLGGGISGSNAASSTHSAPGGGGRSSGRYQPPSIVGSSSMVSHGLGDVVDVAFLTGYTEPTLLILHSNPKRGGGRAWAGRLGRTAEVPSTTGNNLAVNKDNSEGNDDDDMEIEEEETEAGGKKSTASKKQIETMSTGTKYGLTLSAISLSIHQRRSVVLWSLIDAMPVDAWKLVPHPSDGVLVWGVNTVVYVTMGGRIQCSLAVNGFAKIGCPAGLIPGNGGGSSSSVLKPNPSPLPKLALQLDGSRVSFVTHDVALVCLGNGTLHSLELHNNSTLMSLFPLGHRVGGTGVASCLSVLATNQHARSIHRFLADDHDNEEEEHTVVSGDAVTKKEEAPIAAAKEEEEEEDFSSMTVTQLKAKLKKFALPVSGRKQELIDRLKQHVSTKKEEEIMAQKTEVDAVVSSSDDRPLMSGPRIRGRGLIFVGSRMGDCTLLAFSMKCPVRLVDLTEDNVDGDENIGGGGDKRKSKPEHIASGEPVRKQPKLEGSKVVEVLDEDNGGTANQVSLTEEEILSLEEEELYRMDDEDVAAAAPSVVSSSQIDSDEYDDEEDEQSDSAHQDNAVVRHLSMFHNIHALDSLTGLGPLGGGCYGPVATCPSLLSSPQGNNDAIIASSSEAQQSSSSAIFSNAFSSAARHYIVPCGYGASGGLAILTTPGRDNVGGSILCESDLCNIASGAMFGLPKMNLVLLGKAGGVAGCVALRGVVREEEAGGVEELFEELDVLPSGGDDGNNSMDVDDGGTPPTFEDAADVLGKMSLLAATEFSSSADSYCFSVFFVKDPKSSEDNDPFSIVIMSPTESDKEKLESNSSNIGLRVNFVHRIKNNSFFNDDSNRRGALVSMTPMVSNARVVTFGCVWTSGHASVFNVSLEDVKNVEFKVSESIFVGDNGSDEDVSFYESKMIVSMDVISLPNHIFDSAPTNASITEAAEKLPATASATDPSSSASMSFLPDRLSMHGTWCAQQLDGNSNEAATAPSARILIAICRKSGLLEIYDNPLAPSSSPLIEFPSSSSASLPIWQSNGCSHGTSILGESPSSVHTRRPENEVECSEIRFFVAGPSLLSSESISGGAGEGRRQADAEKDAWMLRSLCLLVDTSYGDLHLYSASKRLSSNGLRLEFSRVPLSNVTRPSEEQSRHLTKLRRKGIVPPSSAAAAEVFRPNRLHRFCRVSGEDGLFAATPRPLWFVAERGAMTVVSHKSRHVSPAGTRPVPISGFCTAMPDVFENGKKGFITIHERIGRVGSQRLTLYNGLYDVFSPHGLLPGGGISIQKVPLGVTVRHIEFIDDASISTTSRPVYAMLVSHEIEADQSYLNDDGLTTEERQRLRDEKEAARVRKQVEADLGGFDLEQEWVEEIEREDCFTVDTTLGMAPPMPTRKYELWLVDASRWSVLDKYGLNEYEHGTALKVLYVTDVVEDSDETPERHLVIAVGTSVIDPDGEDLASKGRILLFQAKKSKKRALLGSKGVKNPPLELMLKCEKEMALGPVTSLSSLKSEDVYRIVVGAGAEVTVEQFSGTKLTQVGFYHAHMHVQEVILFKTFFLLSDAYDSLHFLVWRESDKSLTLLAKDYEPTEVFAAGLISRGGAMSFVCHDDRQNLSFLQYAPTDAAARGGNKLVSRADFHMGSQTTSLKSHWCQSSLLYNSCTTTSTLAALKQQDTLFGRLEDDNRFAVNFGTSDGSFGSIVPLSEPTYWRLTALQSVMSNALESNCALSHRAWRLYRRSTRRAGCRSNDRKKGVIDGDLVMKFVDLPMPEMEDLASSIGSTVGLIMDNLLELGCAASVI